MSHQLDIFAQNEREVRTFAPWQDPARVDRIVIEADEDFDHVGATVNGQLPVGAVGNNRAVQVLYVLDAGSEPLASYVFADTDEGYAAAIAKRAEIWGLIAANRQGTLL